MNGTIALANVTQRAVVGGRIREPHRTAAADIGDRIVEPQPHEFRSGEEVHDATEPSRRGPCQERGRGWREPVPLPFLSEEAVHREKIAEDAHPRGETCARAAIASGVPSVSAIAENRSRAIAP